MARKPTTPQAPAVTEIYGPLPATVTRADDFLAESHELKAVSMVDLLRARMVNGAAVIRDVKFKHCRIEGPGVLLVLGCHFEACDFGNPNGDIRNLILRPASGTAVIGAIPIDNCSFDGCQFVGLGYTGVDAFLDQIIALGSAQ